MDGGNLMWFEEHWAAVLALVSVATAWGHNMTRITALEAKLDREIGDRKAQLSAVDSKLERNSEKIAGVSDKVARVETKCDLILDEVRKR